jgi:hypothetical protein
MPDPLLVYTFATDPAPLIISAPTAPQQGLINIGTSPGKQSMYTDRIRIAVPVEPGDESVYTVKPQSSVSTARWVDQSVDLLESATSLGFPAGQAVAVYTFASRYNTDDRIDYPLAFGLLGEMTSKPGSFTISIQEHSGTTADRTTYVERTAAYQLSKSTATMYLRNLVASTTDRQTVPATQVKAGVPLLLRWSSNAAWFELYAGDQAEAVYRGSAQSVKLDHGITRDTTFFLVASTTGGTGTDQPQSGFQTIYSYATLSLAVTDQTLGSLDVSGKLDVHADAEVAGATTVGGLSTAGTVKAGKLDVPTVSAPTVNATQSVTAPKVMANVLSSTSDRSPLLRDDNNHVWLFKWAGGDKDYLTAQIFMADSSPAPWGGLKLPVLGYKTFVIDHPLDPDRYLVHATLEAPEAAVTYRGTDRCASGRAEVALPAYADALVDPDSWTVHLTNVDGFDQLAVETIDDRPVHKGRFVVVAQDPSSSQTFHWSATGTRRDQPPLDVEPVRHGLDVHSVGPYTFAVRSGQPST